MAETVRATAVDPITLEVVKNALASIADEMALVIMRSAYSPVVRDTMDYSTALCDRNGRVVAQGLTLAVQLGTFPTVMGVRARASSAPTAQPGDVYIANDPYGCGGQHLPDIYVIKPIFVDGALEGWAATMAHHTDVGGIAPGSVAVHATEIYQEGLRIPLSKLVDGGRRERDAAAAASRRTPASRSRSSATSGRSSRPAASASAASRRCSSATAPRRTRYMDELQRVAERMMRAELAALPDGTYTFTDYIDGVGDSPEPIAIVVARRRSRATRWWSTSRAPRPRSRRASTARSGWSARPATAPSAGSSDRDAELRGLHDADPRPRPRRHGRQPRPPAACGARGVIGYRVYDAIMGALAQLVPDRVIAAGEGGPTLIAVIGGYDRSGGRSGRPRCSSASWGARANRDGLEGVSNPLANLANQPVELLEADLPLRWSATAWCPTRAAPGGIAAGSPSCARSGSSPTGRR